jgi:hypothetical protein
MKFSKQFSLYESEATGFLKSLKTANPKLEQSQRDGRALLWDKAPVDLETQKTIWNPACHNKLTFTKTKADPVRAPCL